jgi:hypothetical protein
MNGAFDGATGGAVTTGAGTVAVVPKRFDVLAESSDSAVAAGTVGALVACGAVVVRVVFVAAVVVTVCVAASPAKSPVPASAPASDQLVNCLIRARPASRSRRLRGVTPRALMTRIVVREI